MKLIYKIIAGCFFWLCFVLVGTMPVYGAEPVVVRQKRKSAFLEAANSTRSSRLISLSTSRVRYTSTIKTRLNDDGEDYYGIIRHSTARGLPSAIIEHCHLDEETDVAFYDFLKNFLLHLSYNCNKQDNCHSLPKKKRRRKK